MTTITKLKVFHWWYLRLQFSFSEQRGKEWFKVNNYKIRHLCQPRDKFYTPRTYDSKLCIHSENAKKVIIMDILWLWVNLKKNPKLFLNCHRERKLCQKVWRWLSLIVKLSVVICMFVCNKRSQFEACCKAIFLQKEIQINTTNIVIQFDR